MFLNGELGPGTWKLGGGSGRVTSTLRRFLLSSYRFDIRAAEVGWIRLSKGRDHLYQIPPRLRS